MFLLSSMILCLQVISILFHASLSISISYSSEISTCPTWTYPSPPHNECVCGDRIDGGIFCDPDTLTVSITTENICMFFSEQLQTTLVGTCPYSFIRQLPRNVSQMKGVLNFAFIIDNRKGNGIGNYDVY